ncbi:hypothetical protein ACU6U9_20085 [Pseudomonas sp. HK3]
MRLLFILLFALPNVAVAYPVAHYIGFGSGYASTETEFNDQIRTLGAIKETPSYSDVSSADAPWHGFVGFRFHPNYGIEVGYRSYGSIEFTKTLTTLDTSQSKVTSSSVRQADISTQGFYIEHVLSYAITDYFIIQGRGGVLIGNARYTDTETLTTFAENGDAIKVVQPNTSNDGFIKGQVAFSALLKSSDQWLWRLQVNQIDIDHSGEQESFSHWYTSLSLEYQLQE